MFVLFTFCFIIVSTSGGDGGGGGGGHHKYPAAMNFTKILVNVGLSDHCISGLANSTDYNDIYTSLSLDWTTQEVLAQNKYQCCYYWEVLDVQHKFVNELCDQNSTEKFSMLKTDLIGKIQQGRCNKFPYNNVLCRKPAWFTFLFVLCTIILIIVVAIFAYKRVYKGN
ncbi:uncharacterized protein LOC128951468 [Oppia nitens]|uniref:uncharacterized protein LOC128951468 n=1 Tax=Oppia nitens TaxID=1686743 RepID=UPI0023DC8F9C|nr:uncharacterized protein LOC128951468 [Oppia nitens]